jgi:hypothetical protein
MKKTLQFTIVGGIVIAVVSGRILPSCSDQSVYSKKICDLNDYVQGHKDSLTYYLTYRWDELNSPFENKEAHLAQDTLRMNQAQKDSFYMIVNNWAAFKEEFSERAAEKAQVSVMDDLRKSLTLDGIRIDYADLKEDRIAEQYQHFVDVVKANKDNYTKEQWLVVNVSWKELNGRRKEISKDLKAPDGAKIAKVQLEYTAIKAINRPLAESEYQQ